MKTIRIACLITGVGFIAAGGTALADDALQIAGSEVRADGVLTPRLAEVVGDSKPTTTPILSIDHPHVAGSVYQISGIVEYSDVVGDGYLEMESTFPEGEQAVTRALDPTGSLGKLSGSSGPRSFALPLQLVAGAPPPTRLVLNVVLPGPGQVRLSGLRISGDGAGAPVGAAKRGWSSRAVGLIGGTVLAVAAATVGILCAFLRYRRFAEALLVLLLGLGVGGLVAAAATLALGRPREVWFPLLLLGFLGSLVPIASRRRVRRRYARAGH
jgi:hypothetical protein